MQCLLKKAKKYIGINEREFVDRWKELYEGEKNESQVEKIRIFLIILSDIHVLDLECYEGYYF